MCDGWLRCPRPCWQPACIQLPLPGLKLHSNSCPDIHVSKVHYRSAVWFSHWIRRYSRNPIFRCVCCFVLGGKKSTFIPIYFYIVSFCREDFWPSKKKNYDAQDQVDSDEDSTLYTWLSLSSVLGSCDLESTQQSAGGRSSICSHEMELAVVFVVCPGRQACEYSAVQCADAEFVWQKFQLRWRIYRCCSQCQRPACSGVGLVLQITFFGLPQSG